MSLFLRSKMFLPAGRISQEAFPQARENNDLRTLTASCPILSPAWNSATAPGYGLDNVTEALVAALDTWYGRSAEERGNQLCYRAPARLWIAVCFNRQNVP